MGLFIASEALTSPAHNLGAAPAGATVPASGGEPIPQIVSATEHQSRYQRAYSLAVQLTAGLGIRGFKLNLAVEAAMGYTQLLELLPKIQQSRGMAARAELEAALLY